MKKIKDKRSTYCKVLNILTLIILISLLVFLLIFWRRIPDQIPGHFNGSGEIDRWASKYEILICPIIAFIIYLGISLVERHPSIWNIGVPVTESNKMFIYENVMRLLLTSKLVTIVTFAAITAATALARPLPSWFLGMQVILVFGPMIYYVLRIFKYKK